MDSPPICPKKRHREVVLEELVNPWRNYVGTTPEELHHIRYGNVWPLVGAVAQFWNEGLWLNRSLDKESETPYSVGSLTFTHINFWMRVLSFLVLSFLHSFHKGELAFSSCSFSEVKSNYFWTLFINTKLFWVFFFLISIRPSSGTDDIAVNKKGRSCSHGAWQGSRKANNKWVFKIW